LIFIDGAHDYDSVTFDCMYSDALLCKNRYIILDDVLHKRKKGYPVLDYFTNNQDFIKVVINKNLQVIIDNNTKKSGKKIVIIQQQCMYIKKWLINWLKVGRLNFDINQ